MEGEVLHCANDKTIDKCNVFKKFVDICTLAVKETFPNFPIVYIFFNIFVYILAHNMRFINFYWSVAICYDMFSFLEQIA